MTAPMMKCGHAANARLVHQDGTSQPSCAICAPSAASLTIDTSPPDLVGREARCHCGKTRPSDPTLLAFFEYRGPGAPNRVCSVSKCHFVESVHRPINPATGRAGVTDHVRQVRWTHRHRPSKGTNMTTPQAFSVHHVASAPADEWRVDDDRVEKLWLPLIGPTPWALLRLIDRTLRDQPEDFARVTFTTANIAEALGVKPARAYDSLQRLRRFHLIEEDLIDNTYEHPVMTFRGAVRPIGVREWRNLPASVREQFAEMQL